MAFPESDQHLVDPTVPNDSTPVSSLDDYIRQNREALNFLWDGTILKHFQRIVLVPLTQSFDVKGGKFYELDITEVPHIVAQLTSGYEGQIIYLLLAANDMQVPDKQITFHHNSNFIKMRDNKDFILKPGDLLCLHNEGGVIGESEGVWIEDWRMLGNAHYGLVSPNNNRFSLGVSEQGALTVETL